MAKRPPKTSIPPEARMTPRRQRREQTVRLVTLGTYAVLGVAVLLLIVGLADQYLFQPRRVVASVGGTPIRYTDYQSLYRFREWSLQSERAYLEALRRQYAGSEELSAVVSQIDQQLAQLDYELASLSESVLGDLIDQEIVRREAARRGIIVTDDEVQAEIERQFGFERDGAAGDVANGTGDDPGEVEAPDDEDATAEDDEATTATPVADPEGEEAPTPAPTLTPLPTPTPLTEEGFGELYADWLLTVRREAGLSEAQVRHLIAAGIYWEKVTEAIRADTPTTAEQVHVRVLTLDTEEEALAALERLHDGEAWEDVVAELSTDTYTREDAGDLGWLPRGYRPEAFEEVAFSLEPGVYSDVIATGYSYEIIEVLAYDPERPLEEYDLSYAQSLAVSDWFAAQRAMPDVIHHMQPQVLQ